MMRMRHFCCRRSPSYVTCQGGYSSLFRSAYGKEQAGPAVGAQLPLLLQRPVLIFEVRLYGILEDKRMRKVILYIAVSLDGYIADRDGGTSWIAGENSEYTGDYGYAAFTEEIDTVVMGYRTYRQVREELSPGRWVYAGMTTYVLTHQAGEADTEEICFTSGSPAELLAALKRRPGTHIWVNGGADVAQQCLKSGMIDELRLYTMPVLLGGGLRLFGGEMARQALRLISVRAENGVVESVYRRRSDGETEEEES